jgi:hypothetical protein
LQHNGASISTPLGTFGPYPAPAANGSSNKNVGGANCFHLGGPFNSNGKRYILADISGGAGTYTLRMTGRVVASGVFQASLNPSRTVGPTSTGSKFLSFVQPGQPGASSR